MIAETIQPVPPMTREDIRKVMACIEKEMTEKPAGYFQLAALTEYVPIEAWTYRLVQEVERLRPDLRGG